MTERTCRCCGRSYQHPSPGSLSTKRFCDSCMRLPEAIREVFERHQLELTRLRKALDRSSTAASSDSSAGAE